MTASDDDRIVASARASLLEMSRHETQLTTRDFAHVADEPCDGERGAGPTASPALRPIRSRPAIRMPRWVHVEQQQTAQQEQAEAGDRGGPSAQMIGQSSQRQQCGEGGGGRLAWLITGATSCIGAAFPLFSTGPVAMGQMTTQATR